jgi:hypothetical protein
MPSPIRLTPVQRAALAAACAPGGIRRHHQGDAVGARDAGFYPERTVHSLWRRGLVQPGTYFGVMVATERGQQRVQRRGIAKMPSVMAD